MPVPARNGEENYDNRQPSQKNIKRQIKTGEKKCRYEYYSATSKWRQPQAKKKNQQYIRPKS